MIWHFVFILLPEDQKNYDACTLGNTISKYVNILNYCH